MSNAVKSLAIPRTFVGPHWTVEKVNQLFSINSQWQSLAVVRNNIPIGMIHRNQIADTFLSNYERNLHKKKSIAHFMEKARPILIEGHLSIETASQHIIHNYELAKVQEFIITEQGYYKGIGTLLALLKKIAEVRQENTILINEIKMLEKHSINIDIMDQQSLITQLTKDKFISSTHPSCHTVIENRKVLAEEVVKLHFELFDFFDLIQEVTLATQSLIAENGNTLTVQCYYTGVMRADRTKIRQCLINIISNASRFSENSIILLFVSREIIDHGEWIAIGVRDHGIGLTNIQLKKLFNPPVQATLSTTHQYTGLGLASTKKLCEMMGGSISIDSKPGCGSTFVIHLPMNATYKKSVTKNVQRSRSFLNASQRLSTGR